MKRKKKIVNFIEKIIFFFRNKVNCFLRWLPSIFWMVLIFYGSSKTQVRVSGQFWIDFAILKTFHMLEYAILFFFNFLALGEKKVAFFFTFIYSILDEIHQLFVPSRTGRVRDVLIDMIGIMIAYYFLPELESSGKKIVKSFQKRGDNEN